MSTDPAARISGLRRRRSAVRGAGGASVLAALFGVGCASEPSGPSEPAPAAAPGAAAEEPGWFERLNPFRKETRAAITTGSFRESVRPDGWTQAGVDLDFAGEDGPASFLAVVSRVTRPAPGGGVEGFDMVTLVLRDRPERFPLIDEGRLVLVVGRQEMVLTALPTTLAAVKRSGPDVQTRASFALPEGSLERFADAAPVQLRLSVGGTAVVRTLPGTSAAVIQEMARARPITARVAPSAASAASGASGASGTSAPSALSGS